MIVVSGLERSGTSLMMQILEDAGFNLSYDGSRKPDEHNPNGYYELEDGKIILELTNNNINLNKYKNKVIKITAYGIPLISGMRYKVIYMERNIEEVADSQRKMISSRYPMYTPVEEDILLLSKLNATTKRYMNDNDIEYVVINYNKLITNPIQEIRKLSNFLGKDISDSVRVIDKKLYRNRS